MSQGTNRVKCPPYSDHVSVVDKVMEVKVHPDQSSLAELQAFAIAAEDLASLGDKYLTRVGREDVEYLIRLEGPAGLEALLQTNLQSGLSASEGFDDRIEWFGSNFHPAVRRRKYWELVWEALGDTTLRILLVAGLVSLAIGLSLDSDRSRGWIDGAAILIAVLLVTQVTALNDYQKEKKFAKLQEEHSNRKAVTLIREGERVRRHPEELVVGDLVEVSAGMTVPADGVLIAANQVEVSEAAMTGESEQVKKYSLGQCLSLDSGQDVTASPVLLSGTSVGQGMGIMVVTAVGSLCAEGKLRDLTEQQDEQTPLQAKLSKLADTIGKGGLWAAVITIAVLYLRFFVELILGNITWESGSHPRELVSYFIIGVTILVVAIPEGLPLAVTISLAYSVKKMQKEKNLVRRMQACETMGGANAICSDKTGTLTQNKMTVVRTSIGSSILDLEKFPPSVNTFNTKVLELMKEGILGNSTAYLNQDGEEVGSKTEIALLRLVMDCGVQNYVQVRKEFQTCPNTFFPFDSNRKVSSFLISRSSTHHIHIKGAPEVVIPKCSHYFDPAQGRIPLTDALLTQFQSDIAGMAKNSLRTIALAYENLPNYPRNPTAMDSKGIPEIEKSVFTLLAVFGIKDPVRPEVPGAVKRCQEAGITVRMVTGDSEQTALAIALECNIITQDLPGVVISGRDFATRTGGTVCRNCMDRETCGCVRDARKAGKGQKVREDVVKDLGAFSDIVMNMRVLARSRPEDKYTLVTGLRQMGDVVAVTGDGTNDAPALKKADVGFAMGLSGTEMAKEAASIILLDDNFASIVNAIKWGRNIYDNIRCFLQFQLTVNIVAVAGSIIGACTIQQTPLTAVQMLWVNLIMDSFASLALATEEPTEAHLHRLPQSRTEKIVSVSMWKMICGQSVLQLTVILLMMFYGENFLPEYQHGSSYPRNPLHTTYVRSGRLYTLSGDEDYKPLYDDSDIGPSRHFTYIFNTFVLLQLFNQINCRKLGSEWNIFHRVCSNAMFWTLWVLTWVGQVVMVQAGGTALNVHKDGLTAEQWGICVGLGMTPLLWRLVLINLPDWTKVAKLSYRPPRTDVTQGYQEPSSKRRSPRNLKTKVLLMD